MLIVKSLAISIIVMVVSTAYVIYWLWRYGQGIAHPGARWFIPFTACIGGLSMGLIAPADLKLLVGLLIAATIQACLAVILLIVTIWGAIASHFPAPRSFSVMSLEEQERSRRRSKEMADMHMIEEAQKQMLRSAPWNRKQRG